MSGGALAIFVKTPGRSTVKSRLAAGRGECYAVEWYRRAAAAVASVARQAQARHGVAAYWAVAEADGLDAWPGLPTLHQGEGGLGERMSRVHAWLVARHGFGMLLGADAPQLTAGLLDEAVDWLSGTSSGTLSEPPPRLLLGHASDGGFWLFGSNIAPSPAVWETVGYSVADTARQLQRAMHGAGEWRTLATLTDADHASDLAEVRRALEALPEATPEQRELARWMREQETAPPPPTGCHEPT